MYCGSKLIKDFPANDLYGGKIPWNLNPGNVFTGHVHFPQGYDYEKGKEFRAEFHHSIIDALKRIHEMLPVSYVYNEKDENEHSEWWVDPKVEYFI